MTDWQEIRHKEGLLYSNFLDTLVQCEEDENGNDDTDDRFLFRYRFVELLEAVYEFYEHDFDNPIIKEAFNDKFQDVFNELKELEISLKNNNLIK